MSHMNAQITDYFASDDTIHCQVCEKDDVTGVEVTFDRGFMQKTHMCVPCFEQVLEFKDRMTDPQYKQASKNGDSEE